MAEYLAAEYVDEIDPGLGEPLRVLQMSPTRLLASMPWGKLRQIVPDPRLSENVRVLQALSPEVQRQADVRTQVQRVIKSTKKAENAKDYARYLANVIRGERGEHWATPPFALWTDDQLTTVKARSPFGVDHLVYLPYSVTGVLVDAETQHLAHFLLLDDPAAYGVTAQQVNGRTVGVEIYHGIELSAARQIFHDRNLLGVVPNKNVALASDSLNKATQIANALLATMSVVDPESGEAVLLEELIAVRQRQLKAADHAWMTLSTLRSFVVTAIFGKAGFERTSGSIHDLPQHCDREQAEESIAEVLGLLFDEFAFCFADRTRHVIAAPAVFAALGAVAHRSMPWAAAPHRSLNELMELLKGVQWARDPKYWDGICGKRTSNGTFSLAGGVKDSGSRTATALEDPESERYRWIRFGQDA
ncbi:DNA sulfur modification protein DndB [Streptomyces sp. NPDC007940]|uniref:DNA sulfur modification protein DndB n=1 Tax=Streptomyces sp. NPDC007940 TaxID=3364796 RepID=UPI0036E47243